jgi:hypothetical protein
VQVRHIYTCDNITVYVSNNTIAAFSIASNASSSDEITTLNLKVEINNGDKLQHFPVPFSSLQNEDVKISMEAIFSQGKSVHLEHKEHDFTINTKVTGHDFYDPMASYLEDFIIFNPLSWFHSKCGFIFRASCHSIFKCLFSQRKFKKSS